MGSCEPLPIDPSGPFPSTGDLGPPTHDCSGGVGRQPDQLGADASSLVVRAHLRIEQEGVVASVPRHIGEPDERPNRHGEQWSSMRPVRPR